MTREVPIRRAKLSPREAAAEAVALFMPEAGPEERDLRARIHHARDIASTRSARATSFDGKRLFAIASNIACEWVFRRSANCEQLTGVLEILARIFTSAGALERLESLQAEATDHELVGRGDSDA